MRHRASYSASMLLVAPIKACASFWVSTQDHQLTVGPFTTSILRAPVGCRYVNLRAVLQAHGFVCEREANHPEHCPSAKYLIVHRASSIGRKLRILNNKTSDLTRPLSGVTLSSGNQGHGRFIRVQSAPRPCVDLLQ